MRRQISTKSKIPILLFNVFMVKNRITALSGSTAVYPETVYVGECRTREEVEALKQFYQTTPGFVRFDIRSRWRMVVAESE